MAAAFNALSVFSPELIRSVFDMQGLGNFAIFAVGSTGMMAALIIVAVNEYAVSKVAPPPPDAPAPQVVNDLAAAVKGPASAAKESASALDEQAPNSSG